MQLREQIEALAAQPNKEFTAADRLTFDEFKRALNRGEIRAAERTPDGEWRANSWVKQGILLGFRMGSTIDMSADRGLRFFDKDTFPLRPMTVEDNVRIVPGGSSIRDGAYIAPGVVCMPPMFVNAGAYVDEGTMIDSHALVGSCAQIGKRVHLSAAAQIGGVLEPAGAMAVIITGSTPVFDLVRDEVYRRTGDAPLEIPAGAVVVPGARAVSSERGLEWGLSLYAPVIVKYRDEKTDAATQLEEVLR